MLEPALAASLDDAPFFDPRRRLAHLAADLRILGFDDATIQILPCPRLAPPRDRAEAFGALYVLEGSTLGGQVIAKHIGRQLGLTAECGCRYYAAHGRETGAMWKAFRQRLAEEATRGEADAIVISATATFDAMRHWLCATAVPPWTKRGGALSRKFRQGVDGSGGGPYTPAHRRRPLPRTVAEPSSRQSGPASLTLVRRWSRFCR